MCAPGLDFTCVLRIQTQILKLVQQVLYPRSHPPVPDDRLFNTLIVLDAGNLKVDGQHVAAFPDAHG